MIPITSGMGHIMEGLGTVAAMDMQFRRMIQTCMLQLQLMVLLDTWVCQLPQAINRVLLGQAY